MRYLCSYRGCENPVAERNSYCTEHKSSITVSYGKRTEGFNRPNQSLYNTGRWRKLRQQIIERQPECVICGTDKRLTVHHINPPKGNEDLFYDPDNLTVVCFNCHKIVTIRESHKITKAKNIFKKKGG